MFFIQNHKLHTSVGKLPVHDEILNKNACGSFALYFLLLRMQSFSHHGATCVEVPHFANLRFDGIILCPSPVQGILFVY